MDTAAKKLKPPARAWTGCNLRCKNLYALRPEGASGTPSRRVTWCCRERHGFMLKHWKCVGLGELHCPGQPEGRMTALEAVKMMSRAPNSDTKPSRVNQVWTQAQAVHLVREWIASYPPFFELSTLMKKRVLQVCQDRKRPVVNKRSG